MTTLNEIERRWLSSHALQMSMIRASYISACAIALSNVTENQLCTVFGEHKRSVLHASSLLFGPVAPSLWSSTKGAD